MDIYAKSGTKVIYTGAGGYPSDKIHANQFLIVGAEYTVDYTDVANWSTSVHLEEFPNKAFNSVHFEEKDKTK